MESSVQMAVGTATGASEEPAAKRSPTAGLEVMGQEDKAVFESSVARPQPWRVLVLRHGARPYVDEHGTILPDPALLPEGVQQANAVASYFEKQQPSLNIVALMCSPFYRALQTASPIAKVLGLPARVEWGFSELLAHRWLHDEDPLPLLTLKCAPAEVRVLVRLDEEYESAVIPVYPDIDGMMEAGNVAHRSTALKRHAEALDATLRAAGRLSGIHAQTGKGEATQGATILIVGHGSTHDFVADALCPEEHRLKYHTPFCVPNCSITEIVDHGDGWRLVSFGQLSAF